MRFHQRSICRARVVGARREDARQRRFLGRHVGPLRLREVKRAVLRQQHQIECDRRVGTNLHRLKTGLFIPLRPRNDRVVVGKIIVEGQLQRDAGAAHVVSVKLLLSTVCDRQ
jgi:hypothetical protein